MTISSVMLMPANEYVCALMLTHCPSCSLSQPSQIKLIGRQYRPVEMKQAAPKSPTMTIRTVHCHLKGSLVKILR